MTKNRKTGQNLTPQEFMISAALHIGPKHGYAISQHIADTTSGQVTFSPATMYSNLSRMVDSGLIQLASSSTSSTQTGHLRKTYSLTNSGEQSYLAQSQIFQSFIAKEGKKDDE